MIASQCRAARALIGWSQHDLAAASGVGIATVRQFEGEGNWPRTATLDALMSALEKEGIQFLAGQGDGPGVRLKGSVDAKASFLAFLRLYDRQKLRGWARHVNGGPQFGYAFDYDFASASARLVYRGQAMGTVQCVNGDLQFDPPLPLGKSPNLSVDLFDAWLLEAEKQISGRGHLDDKNDAP